MDNALELLADLVAQPGPPGQEDAVRAALGRHLDALGVAWKVDARGNLLAAAGDTVPEHPRVVVTAHLDEIALMVQTVRPDGSLSVVPLGGAHVWKWGETPVEALVDPHPLPGVLSLGSVHTTHPGSVAQRVRDGAVPGWADARVLTGFVADALPEGVRPGTRVVLARERRRLWRLGPEGCLVAGYFLDDRADLAAWLLAIGRMRRAGTGGDILFAATAAEELGGHGALWLLGGLRPEVCVALEIGPIAPDNGLSLDPTPTCWAGDGYAPADPKDLGRVADAARACGTGVGFHALTRGGSDASCAAAQGLCARPVTLAVPVENSHGFETMHVDAIDRLVRLTVELLPRL